MSMPDGAPTAADPQPVSPDRRQGRAACDELWRKPGAGQRKRDGTADRTGADDRDRKGIRHGIPPSLALLGSASCWYKSTRSRLRRNLSRWPGSGSIISAEYHDE